MRNLILVAFVEPVSAGMEFARGDWPLHITLLRFDVEASVSAGVELFAIADGVTSTDGDVAELIAKLVGPEVRASLGTTLRVGPDAGFGYQGSIPVSLVEPNSALQELHEALHKTVASVGGRIAVPHYVLGSYRPHISHHDGKRPKPGDSVTLDRVALLDMAPDGDHTIRRVLRLWTVESSSSGPRRP